MTIRHAAKELYWLWLAKGDLSLVHVCAYCRKTSSSDLFELKDGRIELHDEPTSRLTAGRLPADSAG